MNINLHVIIQQNIEMPGTFMNNQEATSSMCDFENAVTYNKGNNKTNFCQNQSYLKRNI